MESRLAKVRLEYIGAVNAFNTAWSRRPLGGVWPAREAARVSAAVFSLGKVLVDVLPSDMTIEEASIAVQVAAGSYERACVRAKV